MVGNDNQNHARLKTTAHSDV